MGGKALGRTSCPANASRTLNECLMSLSQHPSKPRHSHKAVLCAQAVPRNAAVQPL